MSEKRIKFNPSTCINEIIEKKFKKKLCEYGSLGYNFSCIRWRVVRVAEGARLEIV